MGQHSIKEITAVKASTKPGVYKIGKKIVTVCGKSNVQQSDKDLTNLNKLLEPAMKKGLLRHTVKFAGQYDDIPVADYQEAQLITAKAKSMYEELPMNIRAEFDTPAKFLEFVQNPKNANKMQEMGILAGNDGKTADGKNSGAPSPGDMDGDGVKDPEPTPPV
jgi:hypothetical protein